MKKLGILGGGQLGKMMCLAAADWDLETFVLDTEGASAQPYCKHFVVGNFKNYDDVVNFGRKVDVLTIEIEHVNIAALKQLESEGQLLVLARPSEDQEVFELNFRTNRLTAFVQLQLVQIDDNAILSKELCDAIHRFAPSKILVDHRQCVDLDLAIMNGFEFSKVFVVECGEVTHYYKDSCIERSSLTRKVA